MSAPADSTDEFDEAAETRARLRSLHVGSLIGQGLISVADPNGPVQACTPQPAPSGNPGARSSTIRVRWAAPADFSTYQELAG
jgi:hypothetical protein